MFLFYPYFPCCIYTYDWAQWAEYLLEPNMLICNFCITGFEGIASQDFCKSSTVFFQEVDPYGFFIRVNVLKFCRVGIQFREGSLKKSWTMVTPRCHWQYLQLTYLQLTYLQLTYLQLRYCIDPVYILLYTFFYIW